MFSPISIPLSALMFLALYIRDKNAFKPPLTREEEQRCLTAAAAGDREARNKLIEHNLRLVAHIAKKYTTIPSMQDELISIGTIGLIKAASGFSGERNIRFSTYASKCITNEILMHFRAGKKSERDISLYEPVETENACGSVSVIDTLTDDYDLEESVLLRLDLQKLRAALAQLDPRSRSIISMRYGLDGVQPLTQSQIASRLSISRSYVSRIEKTALAKLKSCLEAD